MMGKKGELKWCENLCWMVSSSTHLTPGIGQLPRLSYFPTSQPQRGRHCWHSSYHPGIHGEYAKRWPIFGRHMSEWSQFWNSFLCLFVIFVGCLVFTRSLNQQEIQGGLGFFHRKLNLLTLGLCQGDKCDSHIKYHSAFLLLLRAIEASASIPSLGQVYAVKSLHDVSILWTLNWKKPGWYVGWGK